MTTLENRAAWLTAAQANPLQVGPAPFPTAGPGELVVKNSAVSINPIDWAKQMLGDKLLGHIRYPIVLGEDLSGTVTSVGAGVTRFHVGDRVLGAGGAISTNDPGQGGFQLYTRVQQWLATPLPADLSDVRASTLPLALLTATHGLFDASYLGLALPTSPAAEKKNKVVIITGGSSSVGSTAIQLAVSAGYEVVSTASPKNFNRVKKLGATHVFDYHLAAPELVAAIGAVVRGRDLVGGYSIGDGSADILHAILAQHQGGTTNRFIALTGGPHNSSDDDDAAGAVQVKFILLDGSAIGPKTPAAHVFSEYLPKALATKQFVPALEPVIAGKGLDEIQGAFNAHKKGVSAQKIVVTL